MAKIRFPGKALKLNQRKRTKFIYSKEQTAEELRLIQIKKGLRLFRSVFGDSEEDDFEGFIRVGDFEPTLCHQTKHKFKRKNKHILSDKPVVYKSNDKFGAKHRHTDKGLSKLSIDRFVLPIKSARSSRLIIPNKRIFNSDECYNRSSKSINSLQNGTSHVYDSSEGDDVPISISLYTDRITGEPEIIPSRQSKRISRGPSNDSQKRENKIKEKIEKLLRSPWNARLKQTPPHKVSDENSEQGRDSILRKPRFNLSKRTLQKIRSTSSIKELLPIPVEYNDAVDVKCGFCQAVNNSKIVSKYLISCCGSCAASITNIVESEDSAKLCIGSHGECQLVGLSHIERCKACWIGRILQSCTMPSLLHDRLRNQLPDVLKEKVPTSLGRSYKSNLHKYESYNAPFDGNAFASTVNLPGGWKRKLSINEVTVISPLGEKFKSIAKLDQFLKRQGISADAAVLFGNTVQKNSINLHSFSKDQTVSKHRLSSKKGLNNVVTTTLPGGWERRIKWRSSGDIFDTLVCSPDGKTFKCPKDLHAYFQRIGKSDDINKYFPVNNLENASLNSNDNSEHSSYEPYSSSGLFSDASSVDKGPYHSEEEHIACELSKENTDNEATNVHPNQILISNINSDESGADKMLEICNDEFSSEESTEYFSAINIKSILSADESDHKYNIGSQKTEDISQCAPCPKSKKKFKKTLLLDASKIENMTNTSYYSSFDNLVSTDIVRNVNTLEPASCISNTEDTVKNNDFQQISKKGVKTYSTERFGDNWSRKIKWDTDGNGKISYLTNPEGQRIHSPIELMAYLKKAGNSSNPIEFFFPLKLIRSEIKKPQKKNSKVKAISLDSEAIKVANNTEGKKNKRALVQSDRTSSESGPRVKNVCRSAAQALKLPRAVFPDENFLPPTKICERFKSCKKCVGCFTKDCLKCINCINMKKYGGKGSKRKKCIQRSCIDPQKISEVNIESDISEMIHGESTTDVDNTESESGVHNIGNRQIDGTINLTNFNKKNGNKINTFNKGDMGYPINIDYWHDYCTEDTTITGFPIITTELPEVEAFCFRCGSAGQEKLIFCSLCCEGIHPFCLEEGELPESQIETAEDTWVCRRCVVCHVCGTAGYEQLMQCSACIKYFHLDCIGPSHHMACEDNMNSWMCLRCLKCTSCGSPNVTEWLDLHQNANSEPKLTPFCDRCIKLRAENNFCPLCLTCYEDDDFESKMMECGVCKEWIHSHCEGLSDEGYQILSSLPDSVEYVCKICITSTSAQWLEAINNELYNGLETVLDSLSSSRFTRIFYPPVQDTSSAKKSPFKASNHVENKQINNSKLDEMVHVKYNKLISFVNETLQFDSPKKKTPTKMNEFRGEKKSESNGKPGDNNTLSEIESDKLISCVSEPVEEIESNNKSENEVSTSYQSPDIPFKMCSVKLNDIYKRKQSLSSSLNSDVGAISDSNDSIYSNSSTISVDSIIIVENDALELSPQSDSHKDDTIELSPKIDSFQGDTTGIQNESNISNDYTESEINSSFENVSDMERQRLMKLIDFDNCESIQPKISKDIDDDSDEDDEFKYLLDISNKLKTNLYKSVLEFHIDILRLLDKAYDKSQISNCKSFYVKILKKVFPWFDTKSVNIFSLINKNNPFSQPSLDHDYIKGKREPLKRQRNDFIPRGVCDQRKCTLCNGIGDDDCDNAGRLLFIGRDEWVHVNCCLWSSEVYEDMEGGLLNAFVAVARGKQIKCSFCQERGATVGCCHKSCQATYHFMCARKIDCCFMESHTIICNQHRLCSGDYKPTANFKVNRCVYINLDAESRKWKPFRGDNVFVIIGSLRITCLGRIVAGVDSKESLIPIDFECSRLYWSSRKPEEKVRYSCRTRIVYPNNGQTHTNCEFHCTIDHSKDQSVVQKEIQMMKKYFRQLEIKKIAEQSSETNIIPPHLCPLYQQILQSERKYNVTNISDDEFIVPAENYESAQMEEDNLLFDVEIPNMVTSDDNEIISMILQELAACESLFHTPNNSRPTTPIESELGSNLYDTTSVDIPPNMLTHSESVENMCKDLFNSYKFHDAETITTESVRETNLCSLNNNLLYSNHATVPSQSFVDTNELLNKADECAKQTQNCQWDNNTVTDTIITNEINAPKNLTASSLDVDSCLVNNNNSPDKHKQVDGKFNPNKEVAPMTELFLNSPPFVYQKVNPGEGTGPMKVINSNPSALVDNGDKLIDETAPMKEINSIPSHIGQSPSAKKDKRQVCRVPPMCLSVDKPEDKCKYKKEEPKAKKLRMKRNYRTVIKKYPLRSGFRQNKPYETVKIEIKETIEIPEPTTSVCKAIKRKWKSVLTSAEISETTSSNDDSSENMVKFTDDHNKITVSIVNNNICDYSKKKKQNFNHRRTLLQVDGPADWSTSDGTESASQSTLALHIKQQSLARSLPGHEGPYKCAKCKRLYRTKDSYVRHATTCNFEIDSSTSSEEEKQHIPTVTEEEADKESTVTNELSPKPCTDEILVIKTPERAVGVHKQVRISMKPSGDNVSDDISVKTNIAALPSEVFVPPIASPMKHSPFIKKIPSPRRYSNMRLLKNSNSYKVKKITPNINIVRNARNIIPTEQITTTEKPSNVTVSDALPAISSTPIVNTAVPQITTCPMNNISSVQQIIPTIENPQLMTMMSAPSLALPQGYTLQYVGSYHDKDMGSNILTTYPQAPVVVPPMVVPQSTVMVPQVVNTNITYTIATPETLMLNQPAVVPNLQYYSQNSAIQSSQPFQTTPIIQQPSYQPLTPVMQIGQPYQNIQLANIQQPIPSTCVNIPSNIDQYSQMAGQSYISAMKDQTLKILPSTSAPLQEIKIKPQASVAPQGAVSIKLPLSKEAYPGSKIDTPQRSILSNPIVPRSVATVAPAVFTSTLSSTISACEKVISVDGSKPRPTYSYRDAMKDSVVDRKRKPNEILQQNVESSTAKTSDSDCDKEQNVQKYKLVLKRDQKSGSKLNLQPMLSDQIPFSSPDIQELRIKAKVSVGPKRKKQRIVDQEKFEADKNIDNDLMVNEVSPNMLLDFSPNVNLSNESGLLDNTNSSSNEPYVVFELMSDDGFKIESRHLMAVWQKVFDAVSEAKNRLSTDGGLCNREAAMKENLTGPHMLGLSHNAVQYLLEQLPGSKDCHKYSFQFHRRPKDEEVLEENTSGCARTEAFKIRSPYDIFSWLASKHRRMPNKSLILQEELQLCARRATSMELPMAMRYRHLCENAREAVGVFRSVIHGRGLFCKRDIDKGEMVIEYAGQVIRSCLCDMREKFYESKGIGCYMFRVDDDTVIDATMHGNAARFINHSCDPNCFSRVVDILGKKHIIIFALRRITQGEELTYDYKFPLEEDKIPCSCGARRCRKYLN